MGSRNRSKLTEVYLNHHASLKYVRNIQQTFHEKQTVAHL